MLVFFPCSCWWCPFFWYLVMLSSFETWPYTLCVWVHWHVESWNHPKFDPRLAQSPRLGQIQGASCDFSEASMNGSLAGVCSLMGTKTVIGDSSSFWGWLGWLDRGYRNRKKKEAWWSLSYLFGMSCRHRKSAKQPVLKCKPRSPSRF